MAKLRCDVGFVCCSARVAGCVAQCTAAVNGSWSAFLPEKLGYTAHTYRRALNENPVVDRMQLHAHCVADLVEVSWHFPLGPSSP